MSGSFSFGAILSPNDSVNPVGVEDAESRETVNANSGSTDCSFSAIDCDLTAISVKIPQIPNLTNSIKQVVEEVVQRALLSVEKFATKQPML